MRCKKKQPIDYTQMKKYEYFCIPPIDVKVLICDAVSVPSLSFCVCVMCNCVCFLGLNALLATTLLFVVEVSLLARLKGLLCHGQLKVKQLRRLPRVKLVSS